MIAHQRSEWSSRYETEDNSHTEHMMCGYVTIDTDVGASGCPIIRGMSILRLPGWYPEDTRPASAGGSVRARR